MAMTPSPWAATHSVPEARVPETHLIEPRPSQALSRRSPTALSLMPADNPYKKPTLDKGDISLAWSSPVILFYIGFLTQMENET